MVAPCIVDQGIVYQKQDMQRLLQELGQVCYCHSEAGETLSEGQGLVREVFADERRSTMVAHHALYLNVHSFDYLELGVSPDGETLFDLVQDTRRLRLVPLCNPLLQVTANALDTATLEVMMAEVLSANLDAQMDDEDHPAF